VTKFANDKQRIHMVAENGDSNLQNHYAIRPLEKWKKKSNRIEMPQGIRMWRLVEY
jgi:hypothetical protein